MLLKSLSLPPLAGEGARRADGGDARDAFASLPLTQRYALGALRRLSRKRKRGRKRARWSLELLLIILAVTSLAGCERGMHEMYDQPKYKPLTSSPLWPDGNSSRPQVAGTQPYSAGALAGVSSGRLDRVKLVPPAGPVSGVDANGKLLAQAGAAATPGYSNPLPVTPQLLARGQQRFDIYCAPCHSRAGDGDGMIAERGFPHPPSYHTSALRNAPDSHFYQVITDGYGVMYPYADRISPHDRWAIVAYIRALQLSQHAPRSDLSAQDLQKLGATVSRVMNPSPPGRGAGVRVRDGADSSGNAEPSSGAPRHLLPEGEGKAGSSQ